MLVHILDLKNKAVVQLLQQNCYDSKGIRKMKNIENFLCFNTLTWNNSVYIILMLQNYIKSAYRSMPDFIEKIKSGISNVGY